MSPPKTSWQTVLVKSVRLAVCLLVAVPGPVWGQEDGQQAACELIETLGSNLDRLGGVAETAQAMQASLEAQMQAKLLWLESCLANLEVENCEGAKDGTLEAEILAIEAQVLDLADVSLDLHAREQQLRGGLATLREQTEGLCDG